MNQLKAGQQRGGHRVDRPVSRPQICFFCKSTHFEIIKCTTLNKTKACQKRGVISVSIILLSFVK